MGHCPENHVWLPEGIPTRKGKTQRTTMEGYHHVFDHRAEGLAQNPGFPSNGWAGLYGCPTPPIQVKKTQFFEFVWRFRKQQLQCLCMFFHVFSHEKWQILWSFCPHYLSPFHQVSPRSQRLGWSTDVKQQANISHMLKAQYSDVAINNNQFWVLFMMLQYHDDSNTTDVVVLFFSCQAFSRRQSQLIRMLRRLAWSHTTLCLAARKM